MLEVSAKVEEDHLAASRKLEKEDAKMAQAAQLEFHAEESRRRQQEMEDAKIVKANEEELRAKEARRKSKQERVDR